MKMVDNVEATQEKTPKKKRGRKPNPNKKKYYFGAEEEQAFIDYLSANNENEKNLIFNSKLKMPFTKMTESIIRRYNLYPPDEDFQETFDDTMSFLMTKIENFKPDSGYKSFSYCGTIIKNYLIYKINQFIKNQKRSTSYDAYNNEELTSITDALKYSYSDGSANIAFLGDLMKKTAKEIQDVIDKPVENKLNANQIKVGKALIELLINWEDLFAQMGSNKFNKSSILLFLKETTLLSTKEIRDSMKGFKNQYYILKQKLIDE